MSHEDHLAAARTELRKARRSVRDDIREYPVPVSGCDAQYNRLIELRAAVDEALAALDAPRFVATPRTPEPVAGIEGRQCTE